MVDDDLDLVELAKAKLGRSKNKAAGKVLDQVFGKARSFVESGEITRGMDMVDNVLDSGMTHAEEVMGKHGVEDVSHEGVARIQRMVEAGRRLQREDVALDAIEKAEEFAKEGWEG